MVISNDPPAFNYFGENAQDSIIEIYPHTSIKEAFSRFICKEYNLLIVDIALPSANDIEILHTIRTAKHAPILVLTESSNANMMASLLRAGADVCLEKPVNAEVFTAQADAVIQLYKNIDKTNQEKYPLAFGVNLIISPRFHQVYAGEQAIELTRKEFDLLYYLASSPGQVFSCDQLYTHVWGDDYAGGGGDTVKTHIRTLRKKLSGIGKELIQNVWGVGYKFIPPD